MWIKTYPKNNLVWGRQVGMPLIVNRAKWLPNLQQSLQYISRVKFLQRTWRKDANSFLLILFSFTQYITWVIFIKHFFSKMHCKKYLVHSTTSNSKLDLSKISYHKYPRCCYYPKTRDRQTNRGYIVLYNRMYVYIKFIQCNISFKLSQNIFFATWKRSFFVSNYF